MRSWPEGKRLASQAEPCRRDRYGSRCRKAYPTSGLEAGADAQGLIDGLDPDSPQGSPREFG